MTSVKTALVMGAGGFIGSHMVNRLKDEGYFVRAVDLKYPEYEESSADEFIIRDLRDAESLIELIKTESGSPFHEIYQFAADMGGAGFVFTGENDADIMHNSATINLNLLDAQKRLFQAQRDYASSRYEYIISMLRLKASVGSLSPDDLLNISSQME